MRDKIPAYSLVRQLIRPSWNKYNLFNLSRKTAPSIHNKTMFQQKWEAKKETRAYHGHQLNERQFKALWDKRLVGVASEHGKDNRKIPLTSQTYSSLEKRLDTTIFRALFASSTRQAKQMVVHGKVKVNGRQMKQPGYLLKPGDMVEADAAAVIMSVSAGMPSTPQLAKDEVTGASVVETSEVDAVQVHAGAQSKLRMRSTAWERFGRESFVAKPFMSAFAFVPNYLEVSFETCSAIYLRDPVARPGVTELPSPHTAGVHALAANFYQRGR